MKTPWLFHESWGSDPIREKLYGFSINGLPLVAEKTDSGKTYKGEWTYTVSEIQVDGYQPPKYIDANNNEVANGITYVGSGGLIANEMTAYELPSSGGPGTRLFTILGSILLLGAGALLWRRRRETIV